MRKILVKFLLGLVAVGVLIALMLLFYFIGDKIITEVGTRLLTTIGIIIGKLVIGFFLVLMVVGIVGNLISYLSGKNSITKGDY